MKIKKIDVKELKNRIWPVPFKPKEVIIHEKFKSGKYSEIPYPEDYISSCYVKDNVSIVSFENENSFYNESAITSLITMSDGRIIGGTSGKNAHLFYYEPSKEPDSLIDIGIIEKNCSIRALVEISDGHVYGGTLPDNRETDGYIFCLQNNKIERIIKSPNGEGICCLLFNAVEDTLYGLTAQSGFLLSFNINSKGIKLIDKIDEYGIFSKVLCFDREKNIWGAGRWGRIFKYSKKEKKVIFSSLRVPVMAGRAMYTKIQGLIFNPDDNWIYGGEKADGIFFKFNPEDEKIVCLGKPLSQPEIRCITIGRNKKIYGIGGRKGGICHVFSYDLQTLDLKELGILFDEKKHWHGYEFEAITTGDDGRIYLGEGEMISHLFVLQPK